ncbi:MAG: hypothetical protein ACXU9L_14410 [Thermodesulfobacteriota bacterium]
MNVANILPEDLIQVELKYTELLVPTDGIYEFVYPTVVGPRYSNQSAETARRLTNGLRILTSTRASPPHTRLISRPMLPPDSRSKISSVTPIRWISIMMGFPVPRLSSVPRKRAVETAILF